MPKSIPSSDNLDLYDLYSDESSSSPSSTSSSSTSPSHSISPLFGRDITKQDREELARVEEELISSPITTPYSIPLSREEAVSDLSKRHVGWEELGKSGAGRPTKLTPDRHRFIIDEIRKGTPDKVACLLSGAHEDSLNQWDQRGKRDIRSGKDTVFSRFSIDVKIARSELESNLAKKWAKIATEPTLKRKRVFKEQIVTKEDGSIERVKYLDSETEEEIGDGNWQAIAEFMSRRFEGWKKQQVIEQTGPDGGPIQIQQATLDVNSLSVEAREILLGEIKKRLAELGAVDREKKGE